MLYFSICIRKRCLTLLLVLHFPVLQTFLSDTTFLSVITFNSIHSSDTLSFEVPNASLYRGLTSESTIITIFLQGFYPQTPFSIMLFSRIYNFCHHVSLKALEALFILHYASLCSLLVLDLVEDTG